MATSVLPSSSVQQTAFVGGSKSAHRFPNIYGQGPGIEPNIHFPKSGSEGFQGHLLQDEFYDSSGAMVAERVGRARGRARNVKMVAARTEQVTDSETESYDSDESTLDFTDESNLKSHLTKLIAQNHSEARDSESLEQKNSRLLLERYEVITKAIANSLRDDLQSLNSNKDYFKQKTLGILKNLKQILMQPNNGIIHLVNDEQNKPEADGYAKKLFLSPLETLSAGVFVKLSKAIEQHNTMLKNLYGEVVLEILTIATKQELSPNHALEINKVDLDNKLDAYKFDILVAEIYDRFKEDRNKRVDNILDLDYKRIVSALYLDFSDDSITLLQNLRHALKSIVKCVESSNWITERKEDPFEALISLKLDDEDELPMCKVMAQHLGHNLMLELRYHLADLIVDLSPVAERSKYDDVNDFLSRGTDGRL